MSGKSQGSWHVRSFVAALLLVLSSSATAHSSLPELQDDEGVKLFTAAKQLMAQGTVESIRAAVEKFKQAAQRFHTVGDGWAEGASLTMVAAAETALSDNASALGHLQQALPLIRAAGDRAGEANALANIASAYDNLGEKQHAIDFDNQALAIVRELKDRSGEATILSNIGKVLGEIGEPARGIEYLNQALPIRREVGDKEGEAATLTNLGTAYNILGDRAKAQDCFNQALPIARAVGNRALESILLSNLGEVYRVLGDNAKAFDYFTQALAMQREIGRRESEAITLNNIALVYDFNGEKQKAIDYHNQALALARAIGDRRTEGNILSNLGEVFYSTGEYQQALDYYNQALPLRRAVGDRTGEATTLINVGGALQQLGERQQALANYNQALALFHAVGDRAGEGISLNNIGELYWELGKNQEAIDALNKSLILRREVNDRIGEAITLSNIALIYDRLGEKTRALEFHQQALALEQTTGDRRGEASTLLSIAYLERDRDHLADARARVEAALAIVDSLRSKIVSQESRAAYFATARDYYEFDVDLLMRLHKQQPAAGLDRLALEANERGRARSLVEMLTEASADIRQGIDAALLQRERALQTQLNARSETQMKLLSGAHTEEQAAAVAREINQFTADFQQVEAEIRQKSPNYAALTQPRPLSVTEMQAQVLDADTILLEYSLGVDRSYLWLVTQNSLTSYELPGRAQIESVARELYDVLKSPDKWRGNSLDALRGNRQLGLNPAAKPAPVATPSSAPPDVALRLSRMLLAPVMSQMAGKRLLIVADGALQYIPFGALAINANDSGFTPLLAEHEILMLPSASTVSVLRTEAGSRKAADKSVALLADPVFESDDERVRTSAKTGNFSNEREARGVGLDRAQRDLQLGNSGLRIARLPATRDEAKAIMALAPAQTSKQALDFDANRDFATNADLSRYRFVHFATHGFVDSVHPELSGIVLSLVDQNGNPQDGFLRAHQIFNLNLSADLVVLSACQTGLGKEVRGEGLIGLTRGFMYAGAPRVVVSLWSVNDQATAELMARFYRGMLVNKVPPAAALRAAQLSLMKEKQWQAPFFWAAFTLQGEWR